MAAGNETTCTNRLLQHSEIDSDLATMNTALEPSGEGTHDDTTTVFADYDSDDGGGDGDSKKWMQPQPGSTISTVRA